MNIQVQCCGIVLILVILFFYQFQKKVDVYTEQAFLRIMWVSFICLSLDILSVIVIVNHNKLPELFVEIICKLYLVSLVCISLCGLLYILVDIYSESQKYRKIVYVYHGIVLIGAVVILLLPIHIYYNPVTDAVYTYGPSDIATYLCVVAILGTLFYYIIKQRDKMNSRRRRSVFVWMILWIASAAIQYMNNELLIVGYAETLGVMVIYLTLENPENNLDRETGIFNQNALWLTLCQYYDKKETFGLISLVMEPPVERNAYSETVKKAKIDLVAFLDTIPKLTLFKNTEKELIILYKEQEVGIHALEVMMERFKKGWGENSSIMFTIYFLHIPNCMIVQEPEDLLYLLHYVRKNNSGLLEKYLLEIDQSMADEMFQERAMEHLLSKAIESKQVEVYFQPIYSSRENYFTCAEALVRLRDDKNNIIPPGAFISIAEKNGMISELGEIVFEKVCQFIKKNEIETYGLHYIEVNLSVAQCANENLADEYIEIMKKYQINPRLINLEITESASLRTKQTLLDNMEKLMEYGVRFSLDDFGTGQSNLNYIVEIPVSIVKFDKDMISSYFNSTKAKYVMNAAIEMIHGMQLEIVSEGIETKEQYAVMKELKINYIQGFYFSKPVPEKEFLAILRKNGTVRTDPIDVK